MNAHHKDYEEVAKQIYSIRKKQNKSASRGTNPETVAANTGRSLLGQRGVSETWGQRALQVELKQGSQYPMFASGGGGPAQYPKFGAGG